MDLKERHCNTSGETEPKRIVFTPDRNKEISFPANSSSFFSKCVSAEIDFPTSGINTSAVTDMSRMFSEAAIANPDVSNWNTENVIRMRGMFAYTQKANPDVSNWKTGSVSDLSSMFKKAAVANPDVNNWDTKNVVNAESMFRDAVSADPDVSKWELPNIRSMREMFRGAVSASYLDIAKWPLKRFYRNYEGIRYAFNTKGKTTVRFSETAKDRIIAEFNSKGDFFIFDEETRFNVYEEIDGVAVLAEVDDESFCRNVIGTGADVFIWQCVAPSGFKPITYIISPDPFIAASANPIFLNVGDPLPPLTYRTNPGSERSNLQGELSTTYKPGDPPGEYPITQGTLGLIPEKASEYGFRFTPSVVVVKGIPGQQPEPNIETSSWVDGAKDCNTRKVTQTRTVTTTPYKWDSGKRQWVLDTAKASKRTENRQR
ncbi:BspA family leucine-rich repeat surface protein, partial [Actinotignum sp. GS-2025f]|uniref:BspA family leucine-rich repeat surface protein n=1 Tax=unclassified Actinotignum TaxID=2632702 RepID=UPI002A7F99B0